MEHVTEHAPEHEDKDRAEHRSAEGHAAKRKVVVALNPKKIVTIITALLIIAGAYFGKGLIVAATVNNQPIGRLEVIKELEKQSGQAALAALVNDRLIDNEAKAKGITVSQDEINAEIKTVEDSLAAQSMNLDTALQAEGMTRGDLEKQVAARKKVEKLLGDKVKVTDAEVETYIKDNKLTLDKGKEAEQKTQIKQQLQNTKLSDEAPTLLDDLKANANIRYFVNY